MPKDTKTTARTIKPLSRTVITQPQVEKYLAKVPEEKVFWTSDGNILRDMKDLKDALTNMSDQTFAYHSNAVKRDFSNWVRDIIGDEKLASELESAANREQAAKIVEERYIVLFQKIAK